VEYCKVKNNARLLRILRFFRRIQFSLPFYFLEYQKCMRNITDPLNTATSPMQDDGRPDPGPAAAAASRGAPDFRFRPCAQVHIYTPTYVDPPAKEI
jgi:hypothetical protein